MAIGTFMVAWLNMTSEMAYQLPLYFELEATYDTFMWSLCRMDDNVLHVS
jgi:hypothetical protein